MPVKKGTVIIEGTAWDDPARLRTCADLEAWIREIGFVPLFRNQIPGFSVEERISSKFWQTGDTEQDPWEWRKQIAKRREIAYGKFFDEKSGFISLEWLPYFANFRRKGYDFDYAWENGWASDRDKLIMDVFLETRAHEKYQDKARPFLSSDLKKLAGFGKGGERNFHWTTVDLMMRTYLVTAGFSKMRNKAGNEYGIDTAILLPPEEIWGYEAVTAAYPEAPCDSLQRVIEQVNRFFPGTSEDTVICMLG